MTADSIRLNKQLALHLGVSRREADDLIVQKKVTIDGKPAELGSRITPTSVVEVEGKTLTQTTELRYVALHKPVGYVCSRKAQDEHPTIYDLLPPDYASLKPVGRLDKDSSGIILLSNDGDFAFSMTHPKFQKLKRYVATLDRALEPLHQQMIADKGVTLTDGPSQLVLERVHENNQKEWYVSMREGRNRQIRRTFGSLGYTVTNLHRIQFGPYELANLEAGKFQEISL